ncbi:Hypothetical predicted protein, partial [Pelobates cultripes]
MLLIIATYRNATSISPEGHCEKDSADRWCGSYLTIMVVAYMFAMTRSHGGATNLSTPSTACIIHSSAHLLTG